MARRRKISVDIEEGDLTSMIDVCFLLIAFFIMVTEITKSEVIEVFLPHASHAEEDTEPPMRIIINIGRDGKVYIMQKCYERPNDWGKNNDLRVALQREAEAAGFDNSKAGNPSILSVLVRADAHVEYKYVQCLMVALTHPKVRVNKVHYAAKNPNLKG